MKFRSEHKTAPVRTPWVAGEPYYQLGVRKP